MDAIAVVGLAFNPDGTRLGDTDRARAALTQLRTMMRNAWPDLSSLLAEAEALVGKTPQPVPRPGQ